MRRGLRTSVQEENRHQRNFLPFGYCSPMAALTPRQTVPTYIGSATSAVMSSLMKRNHLDVRKRPLSRCRGRGGDKEGAEGGK